MVLLKLPLFSFSNSCIYLLTFDSFCDLVCCSTSSNEVLCTNQSFPILSILTLGQRFCTVKFCAAMPWKRFIAHTVKNLNIETAKSEQILLVQIISIFHVCMVWIEKSVTRVTDRHHEACRVMPNSDPEWQIFLSTPYTHDRYFFLHTFWYTTFDFQSRTCYDITLFPLKGFYLSFKEVHATSDRRSVLYVNV